MLYLYADPSIPIQYISSGNLYNNDGFLHPNRVLDAFVLILVLKGTLYITQNQIPYCVHENEFVLLRPHTNHLGHRKSTGELSYFWVHFYVRDPDYQICPRQTLSEDDRVYHFDAKYTSLLPADTFLLPETGSLSPERRSIPIFSNLLDISKRENHNATWRCHYMLSSLLLEVSTEAQEAARPIYDNTPAKILNVIEYIRINYDKPLLVEELSDKFNYSPTYLTKMFKQYTGYPLITYINKTRISIAKNLLCITGHSIVRIAAQCGFQNEKYFMRLFKKYEGITPTQYRNSHTQKTINRF